MFLAIDNIKEPILDLFNIGEVHFIVQILVRTVLSLLFAMILGVERANKRHAAGLRTFIIVSLGATIAGLTDYYLMVKFGLVFPAISTALGIGIAIISSYTIIYSSKSQLKGLTTAASLWAQAFVGLTFGFGLYTIGIIGSIVLIICLSVLPKAEIYLKNRSTHFEIHLELKKKTDLPEFVTVIRNLGLIIDDIESNPAYLNSGLSVYTIALSIYKKELKQYKTHKEIIEALKTLPYISYIEELSM